FGYRVNNPVHVQGPPFTTKGGPVAHLAIYSRMKYRTSSRPPCGDGRSTHCKYETLRDTDASNYRILRLRSTSRSCPCGRQRVRLPDLPNLSVLSDRRPPLAPLPSPASAPCEAAGSR